MSRGWRRRRCITIDEREMHLKSMIRANEIGKLWLGGNNAVEWLRSQSFSNSSRSIQLATQRKISNFVRKDLKLGFEQCGGNL